MQILVVTFKVAILKTQDVPDEDINSYKYEEADKSYYKVHDTTIRSETDDKLPGDIILKMF